MREVYANIQKVAQTNSTVLIYGKSGTGKELVSRALHNCSERSEEPFVAINCAALPETLLESELFGYVKGAFTGANKYKEGLFESADGGTLFLDEISSLPLQLQSKLLRVLEERKVRPIGATESIPVDVRIVVATNEPLEEKVQEGAFREDLYYRLSVIPIELPPLRERVSDIPLLVQHFLKQIQDKEDRNVSMEKPALQALQQHNWPGNVRELENAVLRAATLCDDNTIKVKDLPGAIRESTKSATAGNTEKESDTPKAVSSACITLKAFLQAKEREYITYVLEQCGGDKNKAAEILGISLATFYRKLQDA
jgi:transcriptional regulator with PAS, ATPase and Fis domain